MKRIIASTIINRLFLLNDRLFPKRLIAQGTCAWTWPSTVHAHDQYMHVIKVGAGPALENDLHRHGLSATTVEHDWQSVATFWVDLQCSRSIVLIVGMSGVWRADSVRTLTRRPTGRSTTIDMLQRFHRCCHVFIDVATRQNDEHVDEINQMQNERIDWYFNFLPAWQKSCRLIVIVEVKCGNISKRRKSKGNCIQNVVVVGRLWGTSVEHQVCGLIGRRITLAKA